MPARTGCHEQSRHLSDSGLGAIVLENYDLQPFGLIPDACPLVKLERQLITRSQ